MLASLYFFLVVVVDCLYCVVHKKTKKRPKYSNIHKCVRFLLPLSLSSLFPLPSSLSSSLPVSCPPSFAKKKAGREHSWRPSKKHPPARIPSQQRTRDHFHNNSLLSSVVCRTASVRNARKMRAVILAILFFITVSMCVLFVFWFSSAVTDAQDYQKLFDLTNPLDFGGSAVGVRGDNAFFFGGGKTNGSDFIYTPNMTVVQLGMKFKPDVSNCSSSLRIIQAFSTGASLLLILNQVSLVLVPGKRQEHAGSMAHVTPGTHTGLLRPITLPPPRSLSPLTALRTFIHYSHPLSRAHAYA